VEPVDGRPLLHHAIDVVRPLAHEILVVAAPGAGPSLPDGAILVHDPVAFEGPLVGLGAGLGAAHEPVVIVVGGDMPMLVGAVLESMVSELEQSRADVVVLEHHGRPQPLPMALRRTVAIDAVDRLVGAGERRLGTLVDTLAARVVPEAGWRALDPDASTLRDVDTEADLG
jgi:molybdopterin-guanine dinucleotide biosynthesis protein A